MDELNDDLNMWDEEEEELEEGEVRPLTTA